MLYCRVDISTLKILDGPAALSERLQQHSDAALADLSWHPEIAGEGIVAGVGYWPATYDPAVLSVTVDAGARIVRLPVSLPPLRAALIESVKAEAARRILAIAPEWRQRNLTARAAELGLRAARGAALTPAEEAEIAAGQAVWGAIKAVRAASDDIEALIHACDDAVVLSDWDVTAEWPA